jgi:NADP-dependent alcohol dehydrogenase
MYNFEYKNPVKIIFGKGSIPKISEELSAGANILITYGGGSIKKNGVYDQVKEALKNFNTFEFGGIETNPSYETCMKAVEMVKKHNADFLLAVGGGSVADATKFIAAASLYNDGDPWDILAYRYEVEVKDALPIGVVLTLPATGSEMNKNAVISRRSSQEKLAFDTPKVLPQFSILDPECVYTLPDRQISNGIVDAFIHVMEQYLTFPVNSPLQDRLAESILMTLIETGPEILADKKDYNTAANFMWSATMALNGIISVGVPQDWATHAIGHELTAFHGIDHARTLAIVFPGMMNIKRQSKKEKILQYGERIWGITTGTVDEKIDKTISKTVEFFELMGIKTKLSDYNVTTETIEKITERTRKRGTLYGEHKDIDYNAVKAILTDRL